jgi:GntR family colanic acid and biofilm gene transcriptional regulator
MPLIVIGLWAYNLWVKIKMLDFAKAQRISLTQQVENNIKSALIIGALKPGERLVTREIAANQGISITPVREALLRLVSSGALSGSRAAFMVPVLNHSGYREISQIRKNLEGMATAGIGENNIRKNRGIERALIIIS